MQTSILGDPAHKHLKCISFYIFFFFHGPEAPTPNGPESQLGMEEDLADREEEGSEDEWEQVGPRNKTSITRQADFVRTPITDIFGGHIRYIDGLFCFRRTLLCDVKVMNFALKEKRKLS